MLSRISRSPSPSSRQLQATETEIGSVSTYQKHSSSDTQLPPSHKRRPPSPSPHQIAWKKRKISNPQETQAINHSKVSILDSSFDDVKLDTKLKNIVSPDNAKVALSIEPLSSDRVADIIEEFKKALVEWAPDFEPKIEEDLECDEKINSENPFLSDKEKLNVRLQETYDVVNMMQNQDFDSANYFVCYANKKPIGIMALEAQNIPYMPDAVTHPGSANIGKLLCKQASMVSTEWGCNGQFQLDAGGSNALRRFELMGLKHIGPGNLMQFG